MARTATQNPEENAPATAGVQAKDYSDYFTIKKTAFELDLTSDQVRSQCKDGVLGAHGAVKDGSNRWRIPQEAIDAYKANPPQRRAGSGNRDGYVYQVRLTQEQVEKLNKYLTQWELELERKNKSSKKAAKADANTAA